MNVNNGKNLTNYLNVVGGDLLTSLSGRIRHLKKIILKGRGFRGGSDEKMRRMWLAREIVVVGLPPLLYQMWIEYRGTG